MTMINSVLTKTFNRKKIHQESTMLVLKRDGRRESVKFDKITARIEKLCKGLNRDFVEPVKIAQKVIDGLYDGVRYRPAR